MSWSLFTYKLIRGSAEDGESPTLIFRTEEPRNPVENPASPERRNVRFIAILREIKTSNSNELSHDLPWNFLR
jgi:hypothetical protein